MVVCSCDSFNEILTDWPCFSLHFQFERLYHKVSWDRPRCWPIIIRYYIAITNKLKCQKNITHWVHTWPKTSAECHFLTELWSLITLARMAKVNIFWGPSSSQRRHGSGKTKYWPKRETTPKYANFAQFFLYIWLWTPNFGQTGGNVDFFGPIIKPVGWRFQVGKSFYHFDTFCLHSGPYRAAAVTKIAVLSYSIFWAIKVHFKSKPKKYKKGTIEEWKFLKRPVWKFIHNDFIKVWTAPD